MSADLNPFAAPRDDRAATAAPIGLSPAVRRVAAAYRLLMRLWAAQALLSAALVAVVAGAPLFDGPFDAGREQAWQARAGLVPTIISAGGVAFIALAGVMAVAACVADGFAWLAVPALLLGAGAMVIGPKWMALDHHPWMLTLTLVVTFPLDGWPGLASAAGRAAGRLRQAGASPGWFAVDWPHPPPADLSDEDGRPVDVGRARPGAPALVRAGPPPPFP